MGADGQAVTAVKDQAWEESRRRLVTPERLRSFFAPRSVALVGASDNSGWARFVVNSLKTAGLPGNMVPVHPKADTAFGMPVKRNLRDIDEPMDLAFVFAPTQAVEGVLEDAHAMGIKNAIVLASGYGEGGDEGRVLERHLIDWAMERDITLLGPNCLGYINAHAHSAPYGLQLAPPLQKGPVGFVLQSGALASAVLQFAKARHVGISLLTSMGNEGMLTAADVIEYLIEDDNTKVISLFLESIRDADGFTRLAQRALEVGKQIVALKVGRTEQGQKAALAHTGAIAGDDAVIDAALRQYGVVRTNSLEELIVTAGMFGYNQIPKGRRMGVMTASGGACDIISDRSVDEGIEIPDFAPATEAKLAESLPPFASPHNPLDVTGYGLANTGTPSATPPADTALATVCADPNIDFVINMTALPEVEPPDPRQTENRMASIARAINESSVPVIAFSTVCTDVSAYARGLLDQHNLHVLGSIEFAMMAIGHALRWEETRERLTTAGSSNGATARKVADSVPNGAWSEAAAREFAEARGVPFTPAEVVNSADDAVKTAERLGFPVVLKIVSAQITHKSDIGGVALSLTTADEVRAAYEKVRKAGEAVKGATIDGVLVSPMRKGGQELFVGVTVDPSFGPVIAVGLGGIFIEILKDTSLRVLPKEGQLDQAEVRRMLDELRGAPLLKGARGTTPVDLDAVSKAVVQVAESALALGPGLRTLEVNPLWVDGAQVEALDVLIVTGDED